MRSTFAIAALASAASAQLLQPTADQETIEMAATSPNLNVGGYTRQDLGNSAINAPITDDCYTYIGHTIYNDGKGFDPARCIKDCEETTRFNRERLNGRAVCRFVNTYILQKNGKSEGQICSMYTRSWDNSFATNTGYSSGKDTYTITSSYSYSNDADPGDEDSCINKGPGGPEEDPKPTSTTTKQEDPKPTTTAPATTTKKGDDPKTTLTTTTKAPEPTQEPQPDPEDFCFNGRALFGRNQFGRWLDTLNHGAASYWKIKQESASPLFIDRNGALRNANNGFLAFQDKHAPKSYDVGYVDFDTPNARIRQGTAHRPAHPILKPCRIEDGKLRCGDNGENFGAKGFLVTWGRGSIKNAPFGDVEAVQVKCPPSRKFWN